MNQKEPLNFKILLATRKPLLIAVGLGLICLILLFTLLIPQVTQIFDTTSKLSAETPKTDNLKKKLASLENISSVAEYAQVDVVEGALPSKKPLLELLMSLSTVAQLTGIEITEFELSPGLVATDSAELQKNITSTAKNKNFDSLQVKLQITGTFKQIQEFLIQVERAAPFTTVAEMQISGSVSDNSLAEDTVLFRAELVTETYFFTQPISVRVESPLPLIGTPEQSVLAALASFVPSNVVEQTEIRGGGLEDLFKVQPIEGANSIQELQTILDARNTATPAPEASETTTTTP